jgi:hypothetical protein
MRTAVEDTIADLLTVPDRIAEVPMLMALVPLVTAFPFLAGGTHEALPSLARQISLAAFDAVDATVRKQRTMVLGAVEMWAEVLARPR